MDKETLEEVRQLVENETTPDVHEWEREEDRQDYHSLTRQMAEGLEWSPIEMATITGAKTMKKVILDKIEELEDDVNG